MAPVHVRVRPLTTGYVSVRISVLSDRRQDQEVFVGTLSETASAGELSSIFGPEVVQQLVASGVGRPTSELVGE